MSARGVIHATVMYWTFTHVPQYQRAYLLEVIHGISAYNREREMEIVQNTIYFLQPRGFNTPYDFEDLCVLSYMCMGTITTLGSLVLYSFV